MKQQSPTRYITGRDAACCAQRLARISAFVLFGVFTLLVILLALAPTALAQDTGVTDDQVNSIAKRMYCPVCENIPLDACGTAACADWRSEIRLMLEDGYTEEQIRADFVERFGDRVVGTPQNPALRAMSLVTPWLLAAGAVVVAVMTLRGWRHGDDAVVAPSPANETAIDYRELLERDLKGDLG